MKKRNWDVRGERVWSTESIVPFDFWRAKWAANCVGCCDVETDTHSRTRMNKTTIMYIVYRQRKNKKNGSYCLVLYAFVHGWQRLNLIALAYRYFTISVVHCRNFVESQCAISLCSFIHIYNFIFIYWFELSWYHSNRPVGIIRSVCLRSSHFSFP